MAISRIRLSFGFCFEFSEFLFADNLAVEQMHLALRVTGRRVLWQDCTRAAPAVADMRHARNVGRSAYGLARADWRTLTALKADQGTSRRTRARTAKGRA